MHKGSCLCGTVRYEVDGELGPVVVCHCRRCRKATGSAFATNAPAVAAGFRVTAGADALGDYYYAQSGLHRMFCKACSSPIYSRRDTVPDLVRIRVGTLDTPSSKPFAHIYVASKADWFDIHDDVPQYAELD